MRKESRVKLHRKRSLYELIPIPELNHVSLNKVAVSSFITKTTYFIASKECSPNKLVDETHFKETSV